MRVTTGTREHEVFFAISDTGPGIKPEDMERIFWPFFTTKGEYAAAGSALASVKGTGLGLSVSRSIVKSHQGRIEVQNAADGGALFTVMLPAGLG